MEENNSVSEKDLAKEKRIIAHILDQIDTSILNGKEEITLSSGSSFIPIKLLKDNEVDGVSIEFGGTKIATIKKGEDTKKINAALKREIKRYRDSFNFNRINGLNLDRQPTAKEQTNMKSLKLEAELKTALSEGRATALRTGREITDGESLGLMFERMFGVETHEVYRVKDKNNPHGFKYICKDISGEYVEPMGNSSREGKNPNQKCWVQDTNGKLERKTVDHMITFGRYALATDIQESAASEHTRTLIGVRCPGEGYIFMPALDNRIINTPQNGVIKENLTRANSILDIEDVVIAANLGNTIYGTKKDGKLTVEEIEFIKKLQSEGIQDEKIAKIIDMIVITSELKIQGLRDTHIKAILDSVETVAEQIEELREEDYKDEEIKEAMESVYYGERTFEEAKDSLEGSKEEREEEDRFPVRGEIPEGPWRH